jgi:hypothetical protein
MLINLLCYYIARQFSTGGMDIGAVHVINDP